MKVRDQTTQAHETVLQLRDVRQQINDRVAKAGSAGQISTAAQALNAKLADVEEAIYNVKLASGQDLFNRPIRLNNRLTVLEKIIESADAKPTDQCVKMLTQLAGELEGILRKYDAAMKSDLGQFNTLLASQNLPPVKMSPSPVEP
jgi:division protein CdvB (Snf7/Vps24/ESCRT-III family)